VVDFKSWRTENNVDFIVVDLAGSEIYQNTHHLFLDSQAMYLLVYDHRKYTAQTHHEQIGKSYDVVLMLGTINYRWVM
jgi:hypothetical protein